MNVEKTIVNSSRASFREQALSLANDQPRISGPDDPVVQYLTRAYQQAFTQAQTQFEHQRRPFQYMKKLTGLTDELVRTIWLVVHQQTRLQPGQYCCVALGGYGRKELYPYSDIDLLILYHGDSSDAQQVSRGVLHSLWDLGLKTGHACRSIEDSIALAKEDLTVLTSLLDARFLAGSHTVYQRFAERYRDLCQSVSSYAFVEAKLDERVRRLEKHGDSRFLLEPNVKENPGGLRDLHLLYWLARYHYQVKHVSELVTLGVLSPQEYRDFTRAHRFLARIRIQLHLSAGRADERLTFDKQKELGELLGYRSHEAHRPVERFMKRYFQTARLVGHLTRLFCALIEEEQSPKGWTLSALFNRSTKRDDFIIRGKRIMFDDHVSLQDHPIRMLELYALAQEKTLHIHPKAIQAISRHLGAIDARLRKDTNANALFMRMLLSSHRPDLTLTRMNEIGLLGKFIPDFAYVVGQIQYDRYHVYTVDEHTIRLIGFLRRIEQKDAVEELPLASEIIHQIQSRTALYVAALCHDIAKGRGGNHEQLGIQITRKLGKRFGLDDATVDMAAWLVEHHLLFSHTAFSRDLDDPQTIIDFVQVVQSPERLKLLLLITVADIHSVGPGIWNGWKGALLRNLFARAEREMGTPVRDSRELLVQQAQQRLLARLTDWPESLQQLLCEQTSHYFWLSIPEEYHGNLAELMRQVWQREHTIAMDYNILEFEAITHIRLCLPDYHGLMHHIAGCITMLGGSILAIKSVTVQDGLTLMLLDIQDKTQQAYAQTHRLDELPAHIQDAISGTLSLDDAVNKRRPKPSKRQRALESPPAVYIDNHLSKLYTVIEVNASDRIGLLYDMTGMLRQLNLNIASSQITTYGEKAVDVFYIHDMFGQKVTDATKLDIIRSELLAMLAYHSWKGMP